VVPVGRSPLPAPVPVPAVLVIASSPEVIVRRRWFARRWSSP
jgi:hypothetical protein